MATQRTAEQIRNEFLSFFKERGHTVVPSDSLVPGNDPTLLFTNAGMNQFKDVFLGDGKRSYIRAVDTQKCLRVSGKHNDLEEVGYDTYHHTFFEMLGNWSFGDYFKKEAIAWAWELVVDQWGLDPGRIYVTIHEGDEGLGLEADDEAAGFWKTETTISPDHILACSSKDNFWMMGDTGPCGPCSEMHIDLRADEERNQISGRDLVNADDADVIEFWNLVFIQYNAQQDGSLQPLKAKHVDTGMGFERMVRILQGKTSNYDTDLFVPILDRVAALSSVESMSTHVDALALEGDEGERIRIAMRVIADHVRTISFAIADGVMPGNAGRGYVIRRILRRAVRYAYQTLGFREPVLNRLVSEVVNVMGAQFPELQRGAEYIRKVVTAEEESFLETLGTGIDYFETILPYVQRLRDGALPDAVETDLRKDRAAMDLLHKAFDDRNTGVTQFLEAGAEARLPGEVAFLLHDTYGFPVDLTTLMAREQGLGVDMDRYVILMEEQRSRARSAATFKSGQSETEDWVQISEGAHSEFTGYDTDSESDIKIRMMRSVSSDDGPRYEVLLERTPFYAESGGQVGDTGSIMVGNEEIQVLDTQKRGDQIVHFVDRLPYDAESVVEAQVNAARRSRIVKHHSVTHLMHAALRERLGKHVTQKGSLVAPEHLRFDFSHFEKVSQDDLRAVEDRVNEVIQRNIRKQEDRDVPIKEALNQGAMALFGEKYGERVRMITFDPDYSVELCGGIHVDATGEIGLFRFQSEGSVAAGIRRVEAVAGLDALNHLNRQIEELERVRGQFKSLQRPTDEEVADLISRNRGLEKELEALRLSALESKLDAFVRDARTFDGVTLVTGNVGEADMDSLRLLGEVLRDRLGSGSVAVLGSTDTEAGKVYLSGSVSDDLVGRGLQAGKLVGTLARIVGGGGGGRPTLATAGGKNPEKLPDALQAAKAELTQMLSS